MELMTAPSCGLTTRLGTKLESERENAFENELVKARGKLLRSGREME